jgi:hypothetical protein
MAEIVKWPFGAVTSSALSATGAQAVTIQNELTLIDGATTQATGNRTVNLTINAMVKAGAMIQANIKSAAVETCTWGTGMTAPVMTGVAGKTKSVLFVYDGTTFKQAGAEVQLD